MKDRLASMPFFIGDCLGSMSARLMTLAERGADVHHPCLNRQQGRLENDPKELARWLDCSLQRFHQIGKGIRHKFKESAQRRIYNPWVEAVNQQSLPIQDSSSKNNQNTPLPPSSEGWLASKRLAGGGSTTVGGNEGDQRKPVAI